MGRRLHRLNILAASKVGKGGKKRLKQLPFDVGQDVKMCSVVYFPLSTDWTNLNLLCRIITVKT